MAWRYMVEPTILAYFLVKSTFLDQILRRAPALPRQ
jgi:hypothetical protein